MRLKDVTFCVPYFVRFKQLRFCTFSIKRLYRRAKVITQDTHGNVSWGRNQLIDKVTTKYAFFMDEDMRLLPTEDIGVLFRVMEQNKELLGASGGVVERRRTFAAAARYVTTSAQRNGETVKRIKMYNCHDVEHTSQGEPFIRCSYTLQFGLFNADMLRRHRWDERLPFTEHSEFFYRAQHEGLQMACTEFLVGHKPTHPSIYRQVRAKNSMISKALSKQIMGGVAKGSSDGGNANWQALRDIELSRLPPLRKQAHSAVRHDISDRIAREQKRQTAALRGIKVVW